MKSFFVLVLVAVVVLSLNAGCGEENPSTLSPTPQASILFVHASPDAPSVDVLIDNQKVNQQPLTFPNNTGYLSVNAGARNVKVNFAGTTTIIFNVTIPLQANRSYSVFAIDSASKITPLIASDDLTVSAADKALVRFFHLSPNAPAIDVSQVGQSAGQGLFTNRTFNKTLTPVQQAFAPVDAGTLNLEVRTAASATVLLALPNITFEAGKIYTVFTKGFLNGTGAQAFGAQLIVNNP